MRVVQNLEAGGVTSNRGVALRVTGTVPLPLSDPSTQRSMNGWSPNRSSSGKISGFAAAAASAAFLSAVFRPAGPLAEWGTILVTRNAIPLQILHPPHRFQQHP